MEQTPTFRCKKDYKQLGASKGDIIKMSPASVEEMEADERFIGWRDFFIEVSLDEEILLLNSVQKSAIEEK